MASPLDIGLLQSFGDLFPFLLVLVVIFGIMGYTKLFNDNKAIHAMIAVILAIMAMFSSVVKETIVVMAPWFILFFIFFIFIIIAFMIFGAKEADIFSVFKSKEYGYVNWWVITIVVVIFVGSLTSVISRQGGIGKTNETIVKAGEAPSTQEQQFWKTIVHPKVLGIIFILLIAMFTIQKLAAKPV